MYKRIKSDTVKTGAMEGSIPASFDAILAKPESSNLMGPPWHLLIHLRINLRQRNPNPWPGTEDASGKSFWIERWLPEEWFRFTRAAKEGAELWHEKFWLKPPPTFTEGDVPLGGHAVWRPYIDCQFVVDFSPGQGNAHKTIEVVKLNAALENYNQKQTNKGILNGALDNADGKTFQSYAALWDSLDLLPGITLYLDSREQIQATLGLTITHEIGHALGLDHIGVLRRAPLCLMALALGWKKGDAGLSGGSNAAVCYGSWHWDTSLQDDVMGGGSNFSDKDGLPWVWAMQKLRNRQDERWEVLLQDQHPETGSTVLTGRRQ